MIPLTQIVEWRRRHPWSTDDQVEQDLVICRLIVEIFGDPRLRAQLAFRGGTAIHRLFVPEPLRYSEDIDLVQLRPGQIGPIFDAIRARIDPQRKKGRDLFDLWLCLATGISVPIRMTSCAPASLTTWMMLGGLWIGATTFWPAGGVAWPASLGQC